MAQTFQIKEPCSENWGQMKNLSGGKHCGLCCKKVFDFTRLSEIEIAEVLKNNQSVCARVPAKNSVPPIVVRPESIFNLKTSFQNIVRLIIILAFLNVTVSCSDTEGTKNENAAAADDHNGYVMGELVFPPPQRDTLANMKEDGAYLIVDEMPQFKGGQDSLVKFIRENVNYPETELEKKTKARIFVSFIIDKKGKLTKPRFEIKSCKNSGPFEQEVLSMLQKMPDWKPGKLNGKKVPVKITLPINFKPG